MKTKQRSLQIRELPESVYFSLQQEAERHHRSLTQQAIFLLKKGLEQEVDLQGRRQKILSRLSVTTRPFKWPKSPSPTKWIREDRNR